MPRIFISYRREESELITGRIYDHLASHFGHHNVFRDLDSILFGVDFRKNISEAVGNCDVLVVMIGEQWLTVRHREGTKQGQRRLDDPNDFVRIEVGSALARGIPVIPVLVDGARMPGEPELPEGLQELAYRNATEVGSGRDFRDHVVRLIRGIEGAAPSGRALAGWKAILKALTADPAQRYATAAALAPELRHYFARPRRLALAAGAVAALLLLGVATWLIVAATRGASPGVGGAPRPSTESSASLPLKGRNESSRAAPIRYQGQVDVRVERDKQLLRLNQPGALPMRQDDKFRIEGQIDPPAYVYVVWVDPAHDVTPVYPWDAAKGWGSRPAKEERVGRVSLPPNAGERYTAPEAKPGVATVVLLASPTPFAISDLALKEWFEGLHDLPLPAGGKKAAVWFDDYVEVRDPDRPRTFGVIGSDDPFARWQGQLQQVFGDKAAFQTAVSFARTAGK
jgi:TIR domain